MNVERLCFYSVIKLYDFEKKKKKTLTTVPPISAELYDIVEAEI